MLRLLFLERRAATEVRDGDELEKSRDERRDAREGGK